MVMVPRVLSLAMLSIACRKFHASVGILRRFLEAGFPHSTFFLFFFGFQIHFKWFFMQWAVNLVGRKELIKVVGGYFSQAIFHSQVRKSRPHPQFQEDLGSWVKQWLKENDSVSSLLMLYADQVLQSLP